MIKKRLLIAVLGFSALLSPINFAAAEPVRHENWWYDTLSNYEFVLTPVTGAVVCGTVAGVPGLATGFLLGSIDEALIYSGYASQAHLTAGILGLSMASILALPYRAGEIIGFAGGYGLSTGVIAVDSSKLSRPLASAIAGASFAHATGLSGAMGATVGFLAPFVDDYRRLESSPCAQLVSAANTVAVLSPAIGFIVSYIPKAGAPLAQGVGGNWFKASASVAIVSYNMYGPNEADKSGQTIETPEQLKTELDLLFKRVVGNEVISQISRKQLNYKLGTSILSSRIAMIMGTHRQTFLTALGLLGPQNADAQARFYAEIVSYGLFLVPFLGHHIVDSVISGFQSEQLSRILTEAVKKKTMSGEAPLYLKANLTLDADVEKFPANIQRLSSQGLPLIWSTTDSYTTALHSSLLLFKSNALDVVTFLKSYSSLIEVVTSHLNGKLYQYQIEINEMEIRIGKFNDDIKEKPKTVINGRKLDFLRDKVAVLEKRIRQIEADIFKWSQLNSLFSHAQGITNFLVSFGLVAAKATSGSLDVSSIFVANQASNQLLDSGNWYLKNKQNILAIKQAKESLTKVLDYLDTPCDSTSTLTTTFEQGPHNMIGLNNFVIGISNPESKELLRTDKIELPPGRYVVTGKAGSGKSSFLSKIRGIKCNGIYAHGNITFTSIDGKEAKVVEVTQEDYIAPFSSLIEVLTNKPAESLIDNLEIRAKAIELLLALKIDDAGNDGIANNLDEVKNWGDTLSGGQKRKIALAAMLISKPAFVILDETFAGLDEESIKIAQGLIKEELRDSVVLVVDHQAAGNNHDGFYEKHLHLEDKTLRLKGL